MNNKIGSSVCVICENSPAIGPESRTCQAVSCRMEYQQWLMNRKPVCPICGRRIQRTTSAAPVCDSPECSMRWSSLYNADSDSQMCRCSCCGVFTVRRNKDTCFCNDPGCVVVQSMGASEERQRNRNESFRQLLAAAETLRDRNAGDCGDQAKSRFTAVVVPHFIGTMAVPDEAALARFRENLGELVRAAFDDPEQESDWPERDRNLPEPANSSELPILGQACEACRGKCCREGSDHAYLSVGKIREYRMEHPDLNARDVMSAWLNHLPSLSMTGSCVYHTDRGCNLPREMRSETCNRYICRSLRAVRSDMEENTDGFFIVSEQDGTFHDSRFVVSTRIRPSAATENATR